MLPCTDAEGAGAPSRGAGVHSQLWCSPALEFSIKASGSLLVLCLSRHREMHGTDQADHNGNSIPSRCHSSGAWNSSGDAQGTISRQILLPHSCCVPHRPADIKQGQDPPFLLVSKGGLNQIQICAAHQKIAPMGCSRSQT